MIVLKPNCLLTRQNLISSIHCKCPIKNIKNHLKLPCQPTIEISTRKYKYQSIIKNKDYKFRTKFKCNVSKDVFTFTNSRERVIVIAADETEDSVKAMEWTIENFYRNGDTIHILHVVPYVTPEMIPTTVYYTAPVDPGLQSKLYKASENTMKEHFIPRLNELGIKNAVDMVQEECSETIGEAVVHACTKLNAVAVVVAQHKKHWFEKWLFGSSSQEVAKKAPIPVIVYHEKNA